MRLLILWAGIVAFALIGLFPPLLPARHPHNIDMARLLRDWIIVAVLTGGLLWSEPRLAPWLRANWRATVRVRGAVGTLLLCIGVYCGVLGISAIVVAVAGTVAPSTGQQGGVASPAGQSQIDFRPDTTLGTMGFVREGSTLDTAQNWATLRQINNFFAADNMRAYRDFYGWTTDPYENWTRLTPQQQANRTRICDCAQLILDKAATAGKQVSTEEALMQAHLEVAARGGK